MTVSTLEDGSKEAQAKHESYLFVYENYIQYIDDNQDYQTKRLNTTKWSPTDFNSEIFKNSYDKITTFYCIENLSDVFISWSRGSEKFTYLTVEFYKYIWSTCLTIDEFYEVISSVTVHLYIEYPYIDDTDLDNTIKIKGELLYFSLNEGAYTQYDIKLAENNYEIQNDYLFSSKKEGSYYSLYASDTSSYTNREYTNVGFLGAYIINLQNIKISHYANIYNFYDLIGQLGGIYEMVFRFFSIFALYFVRKMYDHSWLNTLNHSKMESNCYQSRISMGMASEQRVGEKSEANNNQTLFLKRSKIRPENVISKSIKMNHRSKYDYNYLLTNILLPLELWVCK